MKLTITNGPSLNMINASRDELRRGGIPGFNAGVRFPDGREFKIIAEIQCIIRDENTVDLFDIDLKHVRAVGDISFDDAARIPHKLYGVRYRANDASGSIEL